MRQAVLLLGITDDGVAWLGDHHRPVPIWRILSTLWECKDVRLTTTLMGISEQAVRYAEAWYWNDIDHRSPIDACIAAYEATPADQRCPLHEDIEALKTQQSINEKWVAPPPPPDPSLDQVGSPDGFDSDAWERAVQRTSP